MFCGHAVDVVHWFIVVIFLGICGVCRFVMVCKCCMVCILSSQLLVLLFWERKLP